MCMWSVSPPCVCVSVSTAMRVCDSACARKGMCSQRTTATSQVAGGVSYALCSAFLTFIQEAGEATHGTCWSRRYVVRSGMPWAGASVGPCLCWTQFPEKQGALRCWGPGLWWANCRRESWVR